MNHYESIFIVKPSLTEEEVNKVIEKVRSLIEQNGGTVHKVENWGKKKLAYEIEKEKKGTYTFLSFQSDGRVIRELERAYRLDDAVMRYLTIKLSKKDLAQREWAKKKETRLEGSEEKKEIELEEAS